MVKLMDVLIQHASVESLMSPEMEEILENEEERDLNEHGLP